VYPPGHFQSPLDLLIVEFLDIYEVVRGVFEGLDDASSFACRASVSRFGVFCIRKTIRNVMIVVPVFITSCQVSVGPNMSPETPQTTINAIAPTNVYGRPAPCATF
jgi:hypothetical protein